jgi:(p)ppGpp synthase/HD superfamily hydrolase
LETLAEIRERFGDQVGDIVAACSDTFEAEKPPWQERKQAYLNHLAAVDDSVRLVSCGDKLHNARATLADYRTHGEALWDRFNAGRDQVLWYYGELGRIFTEIGPQVLADQLRLMVEDLHWEVSRETPDRP